MQTQNLWETSAMTCQVRGSQRDSAGDSVHQVFTLSLQSIMDAEAQGQPRLRRPGDRARHAWAVSIAMGNISTAAALLVTTANSTAVAVNTAAGGEIRSLTRAASVRITTTSVNQAWMLIVVRAPTTAGRPLFIIRAVPAGCVVSHPPVTQT
jgi:hypothetical protein